MSPIVLFIPQVVPAQYAFVVHTADPLTGDAGTTVGELVVGMGEALVGNLPGRALSFSTAAGNGAGGHTDCRAAQGAPAQFAKKPMSCAAACAGPHEAVMQAHNPRCGAGGTEVAGLPSKRLGLFAAQGGALIVRSDSNGEDLESFAGAGMSYIYNLESLQTVDVEGLLLLQ